MIEGKHQKIKKRLYISFIGQNNMSLEVKPRGFTEGTLSQHKRAKHTREDIHRKKGERGQKYQEMLGLLLLSHSKSYF